jgi:hypothetical protein
MASHMNSSEPQGRHQATQVTHPDLVVPAEHGRQTVLPSIHVSTSSRRPQSVYGEDSTTLQLEDLRHVGNHLLDEPQGVCQHHRPGSAPQEFTTQTVSHGKQAFLHSSEGRRALLPLLPLHGWLAQTMKEEPFSTLQHETIDHDTVEISGDRGLHCSRVGQEYKAKRQS